MPNLINLHGDILNHLATFCEPSDTRNLIAVQKNPNTARMLTVSVNERVKEHLASMVLFLDTQATIEGERWKPREKNNNTAQASVFRVLNTASHGHCKRWDEEIEPAQKEEYRKKFCFEGLDNPDYIYMDVPADCFSVNYPQQGTVEINRVKVFDSLIASIKKKWGKYKSASIAVAEISTWPQEISTQEAVQVVMRKLAPKGLQKVFIVRRQFDGATKVERIFDK